LHALDEVFDGCLTVRCAENAGVKRGKKLDLLWAYTGRTASESTITWEEVRGD
jgi:hypothetical protein